jgi:hypothetical protein
MCTYIYYLHTKFHVFNCKESVVTAIIQKANKQFALPPCSYFTFDEVLTKDVCRSEAIPPQNIRVAAMLAFRSTELRYHPFSLVRSGLSLSIHRHQGTRETLK